jgi:hypothetical protein
VRWVGTFLLPLPLQVVVQTCLQPQPLRCRLELPPRRSMPLRQHRVVRTRRLHLDLQLRQDSLIPPSRYRCFGFRLFVTPYPEYSTWQLGSTSPSPASPLWRSSSINLWINRACARSLWGPCTRSSGGVFAASNHSAPPL